MPKKAPPGICPNAMGRVMKISPGPPSGSRPKANTIGKMAIPARMATRVSRLAMTTVVRPIDAVWERYEP